MTIVLDIDCMIKRYTLPTTADKTFLQIADQIQEQLDRDYGPRCFLIRQLTLGNDILNVNKRVGDLCTAEEDRHITVRVDPNPSQKRRREGTVLPNFRALFPAASVNKNSSKQIRYCRKCHHPRRGHSIRTIAGAKNFCSFCPDKVCTRCPSLLECSVTQFTEAHSKTDDLEDEQFEALYEQSMENHKQRNTKIREKRFKIQ
jgi:hypothetical protein